MSLQEIAVSSLLELDPLEVESPKSDVSTKEIRKENPTYIDVTTLMCSICREVQHSVLLLQLHKSTLCEKHLPSHCEKCRVKIEDFSDLVIHILEHEAGTERKCLICLCKNIDNMKEHVLSARHVPLSSSLTDSKAKEKPKNSPGKHQLQSKSIPTRNAGNLKRKVKSAVKKGCVGNGRSQEKHCGFHMGLLSAPETIWLASRSKQAKQPEKIHLRTTVQIKRLTKLTIEETSFGKWRCNACGKIEKSFYLLQLHQSTNCETGLSFSCEICDLEIKNYSNFVIHYMEHETVKKKKCPICLCPNVNNVKEHLIAKGHVSKDTAGFEFPDSLSKMNHQKPKLAVLSNSAVDGCCQGLEDKDPLSNEDAAGKNVADSILVNGPQSSVLDRLSGFKTEFDNAVQQPETSPEQSVITRSGVCDIEDKDPLSNEDAAYQNLTDSIMAYKPHSSVIDRLPGFKTELDNAVQQPDALSEKSIMNRPGVCELQADIFTSVETLDLNISPVSFALDSEILSPVSNQPKWDNQQPVNEPRISQGHIKKKNLAITLPTKIIQEELHLRQRKKNVSYVDFFDSDMDGISAEETRKSSGEDYELMSSEESDRETLPEIEASKSLICQDIRKNQGGDIGPIKLVEVNLESSTENKLSDKILKMQSLEHPYICKICNKSFSLRHLLLKHIKAHDGIEFQQCQFYCSKLKNKCYLDRYSCTQNKTKDCFECTTCKKTLTHRGSFIKHKRRQFKRKQLLCHICGLSFEGRLDRHIQTHTEEKSLLCERCGLQFRDRSNLYDHIKMHLRKESGLIPEKPFECEICNKKYESRRGYTDHVKKHFGATYECGFCQRKFYTSHRLTEHIRSHTGEKPYVCKICSKTFARTLYLKNHMKSHTKVKPYKCELCYKRFKIKTGLNDHLNTHTGAKPYKCEQCDMCFSSAKSSRKHKRVHARQEGAKSPREKKYSCNICSEVFTTAAYRDLHMTLHTNPNSFSCEFCSKSFNYKKNLVEHIQRVHPNHNPFKCKLCGKTYDCIRKIDIHISSRACDKKDKSRKKSKNHSNSIEAERNMKVDKRLKLFICNMCDVEFLSADDLQGHFNSAHEYSK